MEFLNKDKKGSEKRVREREGQLWDLEYSFFLNIVDSAKSFSCVVC